MALRVRIFVVRKWINRAWQSRWTPAAIVLILAGAWYAHRKVQERQTFQLQGDMLVSGNPHLHEVCLTFDDGPHPGSMDKILDTLKTQDVKATFFVVGKMVDLHPELVRRMMAEGNEVGNHTYTHKRLNQMPLASAKQEIAACAASVKRATGADMTLMRPPGMEYNNDVLYLAQQMGYVTVHWNVVAADYMPLDPQIIVQRVLNQTKDGSVILLHDSPDTAKALPTLIKALKSQGYKFVTTSQMLSRLPRPVYVASNAYSVKPKSALEPAPAKESKRKPTLVARPSPSRTQPAEPTTIHRPTVDAPAWDGPKTGEHRQRRDERTS